MEEADYLAYNRAPAWARELLARLDRIERKVDLSMALDTSILEKITASLQTVLPAYQQVLADRDADKAKIADLQGQLGQSQSDLQAEVAREAQDTADLQAATDALSQLVNGSSTPAVAPAPSVADVPAVLSGDTPVTPADPSAAPVDAPAAPVADTPAAPAADPAAPAADPSAAPATDAPVPPSTPPASSDTSGV